MIQKYIAHRSFVILLLFFLSFNMAQAQNIGIGTENPAGEFHVSAPFIFTGIIFTGTGLNDLSAEIEGYTGTGETNYAVVISNAGPNPNLFRWSDDGGATWSNEIPISPSYTISNNIKLEFASQFGHTFDDTWEFTVGESYLDGLVVKNGDIGIGTANPTKKMDVVGDINFSGDLYKNGVLQSPVNNLSGLSDAFYNGNNLILGSTDAPLGFNNVFIKSAPSTSTGNNNVVIGRDAGANHTTGWNNVFHGVSAGKMNTTGENNLFLGRAAGYDNISGSQNTYVGTYSGLDNLGDGNVFIGYSSGFNLTNVSNKLAVSNSGTQGPLLYGDFQSKYLLLNRTTQITSFEAFGVDWDNGGYGGMYINVSGADARPYYGFSVEGSPKAWIEYSDVSGDVILNNIGGDFQVQFNTASKPVAGSWIANSDARLKKSIESLDQKAMLSKVLDMQGVSYEWNDDKTNFERPTGVQIGFIAQDLQKIWPEKVSEDHQGYLQTAYGDYDPVFVEAIKALHEMLENQAEEIEGLKSRIEVLIRQNNEEE